MDLGEKQWYNKYRPKTIEEYHGEKIKSLVRRRFSSEDKRPNVVLAYGTSGCGKTTILRILSKYYMCLDPKEDGTPCEHCEMCEAINERLINKEEGVECDGVMELDATKASKADMEETLEDALIAPIFTKKKVLILDECHKLSDSTQSLLLKLLENIPMHLIVMMATTNEEKMLDAILNRCQVKMEVHRQSIKEMAETLMDISKKESISVSQEALELIARTENRVPRQCINTLENVAKSFDGVVNVANVAELCSIVTSDLYMDFYRAANSGLEEILLFQNKLKDMDITVSKFMSGLMKFTVEAITIKHGISLEEHTKQYVKEISSLFKLYTVNEFSMLMNILENVIKTISYDENYNDVLLITTAMRISKVDLLAKGLGFESGKAAEENDISLARHIQKIKESAELIEDNTEKELSQERLSELYSDIEEVDDGDLSELIGSISEKDTDYNIDNTDNIGENNSRTSNIELLFEQD